MRRDLTLMFSTRLLALVAIAFAAFGLATGSATVQAQDEPQTQPDPQPTPPVDPQPTPPVDPQPTPPVDPQPTPPVDPQPTPPPGEPAKGMALRTLIKYRLEGQQRPLDIAQADFVKALGTTLKSMAVRDDKRGPLADGMTPAQLLAEFPADRLLLTGTLTARVTDTGGVQIARLDYDLKVIDLRLDGAVSQVLGRLSQVLVRLNPVLARLNRVRVRSNRVPDRSSRAPVRWSPVLVRSNLAPDRWNLVRRRSVLASVKLPAPSRVPRPFRNPTSNASSSTGKWNCCGRSN